MRKGENEEMRKFGNEEMGNEKIREFGNEEIGIVSLFNFAKV